MTDQAGGGKPRLLLLSCGGTISSGRRTGQAVTPSLGAAELATSLPGLAQDAELETRTFSLIPSADMSFDEIVRLGHEIDRWGSSLRGRHGGVVVTHGTDTLEETAFALDLLSASDLPVVVTGAMRNPTLPGADGEANLLAAAAVALAPEARGLGVLVAFNDEIHLAPNVRKSHTSNLATFVSAPLGPIGYLTEGRARFMLRPARRGDAITPRTNPSATPTALLSSGLGDDGRLLAAVAAAGYRGLVIEGVGGGHLPSLVATSAALARLCQRMPVVLASRTRAGEMLHRTYRFPGSEIDLAERGLISAGRLDGPKARVLLTLALAAGQTRNAIAITFAQFGGYAEGVLAGPTTDRTR
jgi:L-asparaginase